MIRLPAAARALCAGLAVTTLQVALAVLLLAPQGPLSFRYHTLVQHDSYWFGNIVERGYGTIVPPIAHKMMEVSNTAFFPGYPALTAALRYGLGLSTENALVLAAQMAALGFWTYFFLFAERWKLSPQARTLGALAIAAHPAAFFLIAAYSESLFLAALLGFLYWSEEGTRQAKILAALHGILMSATRIVGLPCALTPLVKRLAEGRGPARPGTSRSSSLRSAVLLCVVATLGALAFFAYCQLRWGHWDIYMLTQQLGWGIEPDYLAMFKLSSYRWILPRLDYPIEASQMAMTLGGLVLLTAIGLEFLPRARKRSERAVRITFYFAAFVIYFVSVSGVACVGMESMLRYEFCTHALIVLALLHYLRHVPLRSRLGRAGAVSAIALLSAAGLGLQSWYLWNFTRGNWVA
jgi:hypothetical protein